eukprot:CAMPEP_0185598868 /NCGR_PEP_ID=MMETSP0434-20130131/82293_1 /TAXON_ID=626734 ORGANISM="Favella taraikaensis, Strain Fe Narragansett Bay" /NCGR_SAMPLE_ID=MMETSP0434 /ASSEMBLY_ACC=CAM_ASM_000379 /LENGTH=78 /DNA_ID=CAMNT_0028228017 /DNA_START=368 /DNA_END=604 /DNA_ORIENTATION=+
MSSIIDGGVDVIAIDVWDQLAMVLLQQDAIKELTLAERRQDVDDVHLFVESPEGLIFSLEQILFPLAPLKAAKAATHF